MAFNLAVKTSTHNTHSRSTSVLGELSLLSLNPTVHPCLAHEHMGKLKCQRKSSRNLSKKKYRTQQSTHRLHGQQRRAAGQDDPQSTHHSPSLHSAPPAQLSLYRYLDENCKHLVLTSQQVWMQPWDVDPALAAAGHPRLACPVLLGAVGAQHPPNLTWDTQHIQFAHK